MLNWKNIFRNWAGVPVLILLALLAAWSVNSMFPVLMDKFESWQARQNDPSYKDTYGGQTPEETYDLFLAALKNEDVELASKYFILEDQESWTLTLNQFKEDGFLEEIIQELENIKSKWTKIETNDPNVASFQYTVVIEEDTTSTFEGEEIVIPAGNYTNEVVFNKYPSKVWKIATL